MRSKMTAMLITLALAVALCELMMDDAANNALK